MCVLCFQNGYEESDELRTELKMSVRSHLGAFATPDAIVFAPGLPKTRSGKIMRRILRKLANNEVRTFLSGEVG